MCTSKHSVLQAGPHACRLQMDAPLLTAADCCQFIQRQEVQVINRWTVHFQPACISMAIQVKNYLESRDSTDEDRV